MFGFRGHSTTNISQHYLSIGFTSKYKRRCIANLKCKDFFVAEEKIKMKVPHSIPSIIGFI